MPATLKVYVNEDDALLFWTTGKPLKECRGFAIERTIQRNGETTSSTELLKNRMGFEGEPLPKSNGKAILKPSDEWPFQRYGWTDHAANLGDTVSYRVIPMVRDTSGSLVRSMKDASAWSTARTLGVSSTERFQPFFNRGFVISQFMARYLDENGLTLKQFKDRVSDATDTTIRQFLSGDLRKALLNQLQTAIDEGGEIYAALFELSDSELVDRLVKLGKLAHLVLANGSITAKKGEPAATARQRDENKEARAKLLKAKVDVSDVDRFISPGALGHNKFLVRTDKKGNPVIAFTGSTNWTPTGLCTQVNNGLLINDPKIAKVYRKQWDLLRTSKSAFPAALVSSNSKPKQIGDDVTVWFTRTAKLVDLTALEETVQRAKQGVLFLMFQPGAAGLLSTVSKMAADPSLYVRGVVSTLPNGSSDESSLDVNLVNNEKHTPMHLDIIQPEGVAHPYAAFAEEVSRKQFLSQIGYAIVHSKVVVVDPFSSNPIVITGSHNFSPTASSKNDENFIVIEGDKTLAEAYAVNIESAYQHYVYRAYVSMQDEPQKGLKDDGLWQAKKLKAAAAELAFWGL